jgi:hypothetical protein
MTRMISYISIDMYALKLFGSKIKIGENNVDDKSAGREDQENPFIRGFVFVLIEI